MSLLGSAMWVNSSSIVYPWEVVQSQVEVLDDPQARENGYDWDDIARYQEQGAIA